MDQTTAVSLVAVVVVAGAARHVWPNGWTRGLLGLSMTGVLGFVLLMHGGQLSARAAGQLQQLTGTAPDHAWPPVVGEPYPDLKLVDQNGRRTSLAEFKGKVILLEPVGLPCKACVAFAGGHQQGAFRDVPPQADLRSIDFYAQKYAGVDLAKEDIVIVQVLLYGSNMGAPTAADAREWANHFGLDRRKNQLVLAGEPYLICPETRAMIPGFHLIDKDFTLRYLAGNRTEQNLFHDLLPNLWRVLNE